MNGKRREMTAICLFWWDNQLNYCAAENIFQRNGDSLFCFSSNWDGTAFTRFFSHHCHQQSCNRVNPCLSIVETNGRFGKYICVLLVCALFVLIFSGQICSASVKNFSLVLKNHELTCFCVWKLWIGLCKHLKFCVFRVNFELKMVTLWTKWQISCIDDDDENVDANLWH